MSRQFHKPVRRPSEVIDTLVGSGDPADAGAVGNEVAAALLHRVRGTDDPDAVERLIAYADEHGIDDLAELWASAAPVSLPGALWRLYLIRTSVTANPRQASYLFGRGIELGPGADQAVAGATYAPTPDEIVALASEILRGAFTGDFAVALERAAAFCRVLAAGSRRLAEDDADEERAARERERAERHTVLADELTACAARWRGGRLH